MAVVRPINLAVLMPCCAVERDGGIAVSSRLGAQIEMMAELVEHTTIYGYDPPTSNPKLEDRTDFLLQPAGGRISFVSLGPKGTWRDLLSRRRRVRAIVKRDSGGWDALSTPLVNRRVGVVYKASKCRRIMAQTGGYEPEHIRAANQPLREIGLKLVLAHLAERTYRKMAREILFFSNGEAMVPHYAKRGAVVDVVRTSARRAKFSFEAADRLIGEHPRLVTLSRLTKAKGVDDAIRAFALLRQSSMPTATLDVIGGGDAEQSLRDLAEELGVADAITWHGWIPLGPELFALLQQMDVFITLSHAEGLPNTVWECMAQSLLVVTTPVGSLADVFVDGEDVLFVPEDDPAAAAKAVERLAGDAGLRQRMLTRGREGAAKVTVEAIANELLDRMERRWPELKKGASAS